MISFLYSPYNFNPLRREGGDNLILVTAHALPYISIHSAARAETKCWS